MCTSIPTIWKATKQSMRDPNNIQGKRLGETHASIWSTTLPHSLKLSTKTSLTTRPHNLREVNIVRSYAVEPDPGGCGAGYAKPHTPQNNLEARKS
jgi:hypothetical protein